ncbi:hypothetical protein [Microvirga sp. P5_D2]
MISVRQLAEPWASPSWAVATVWVLGLAILSGTAVGLAEEWAVPSSIAMVVYVAVAIRPEIGAYLYLLIAPLILGLPRGSLVPFARPSEGLLFLILLAACARIVFECMLKKAQRMVFDQIDLAFVTLALTSSAIPLLMRFGRNLPISTDDLLYALVLWKYYLIYRFYRYAITTRAQVKTCLVLAMLSSAVVASIAVLQVRGLLGVRELLWTYYDRPFEGLSGIVTDRGTSTLASSFSMADIMAMCLAIALAWLPGQSVARKMLFVAAAGVFVLGCMVSGQFSGAIGLVIAVLTVGLVTGRLRQFLITAVPLTLAASVLLWPVIERRLSGFHSLAGLPRSWLGRLDNLERFVWPELIAGSNWLVGVRPSARIPAPEPWREWIYIESGYAWLLWTGGLPMLVAFIGFVWISLRAMARVVCEGESPISVAATAAIAGLAIMVALMLFDPHLTMRGAADLFFPLLALSCTASGRERTLGSVA